jgi:G:T-mismatch repair DNA endonuclease (very short patch repair protein)
MSITKKTNRIKSSRGYQEAREAFRITNKGNQYGKGVKKIISEEQKKNHSKIMKGRYIGKDNPFFNKTHSNETKKQISKKKKGIKTSDHMSKLEYRKMFSDMKKNLWDSGKMEGVRKKMSDLMKKRISNGEIKGYNRSKVEDEIIKTLTDLSIECSPSHIVESKIFDIFIPKFNLLIEYNGDYWHCNPIKYSYDYINKKKNKTAGEIWEYDKNKLYLAKNKGYNCVVVWETDYKKNKNIILEIIKNYEKN